MRRSTEIIIYYNRKKTDSKRITIRVGKSSISTDSLILENVSARVTYGLDASKNVKRYGISCPLVVPIQEEPLTKRQLAARKNYEKKKL